MEGSDVRVRSVDDIGAVVRERRLSLGLTQQELADRIGMGRFWVGDLERGRASHLAATLTALETLGLIVRCDPVERVAAADDESLADLDAIITGTLDAT